ncbi:MAG: outer membrane beta-barrel protein [Porphyromonadaceae bacterium]|nr:outer membrane beta-barrel protein [Porphyromonadaceae bacterium]
MVYKLSLCMACMGLSMLSLPGQTLSPESSRAVGLRMANVSETPLASLPHVWQVLDQLPFVSASANNISIQGRGEPLLYFGTRQIDLGDLQHMKPEHIERIEVEMPPLSALDAEARASIRIVPKHQPRRNWGGYVAVDLLKQEKVGYNTIGELYWYGDKLSLKVSGSALDRTSNFEQDNEYSLGSITNATKAQGEDRERHYTAYTDLVYQPLKGHEVGLSYRYHTAPIASQVRDLEARVAKGDMLKQRYQSEKVSTLLVPHTNHKVNGYYHGLLNGKWTLHAEGTLIESRTERQMSAEVNYLETPQASYRVLAQYPTHGSVWAYRAYAERASRWGSIRFGLDGSLSQINQQSNILSQGMAVGLMPNSNLINKQINNSIYAHWSSSLGELYAVNLGARVEQTHQELKDLDINRAILNRNTWHLLPSAGITYTGREASLSLNYSSNITRPNYRWLRNSSAYIEEYVLERGNPLLLPRVDHTLSLAGNYAGLGLELSAQMAQDLLLESIERYPSSSHILALSRQNIDAWIYRAQMSYAPNWKLWQPSWTLSSTWYVAEDYRNLPTIEASWDNLINLPWNIICTLGLSGALGGNQLSRQLYDVWQIDASVSKNIGPYWSITLRADDMLTSGQEEYQITAPIGRMYHLVNSDYPDLSLSVSYRFNTQPKKYRGGAAGTTELERM